MKMVIFTWKKLCTILTLFVMLNEMSVAQLSGNFYSFTCPRVEQIVSQAVFTKFTQTPITAQATIRLFFHDCFVQGCDASIMIYSPSNDAERDAPINLSLAGDGFDTVNKAKKAVEAACPGVVSCADILALAARDSIVLTGGPSFNVELGRRDGLRSKASDVSNTLLPEPDFKFSELVEMFAKNNLSQIELIALSGAHTLGVSHCSKFQNRIFNFSANNPVDPSMDPIYAQNLQQQCLQNPGQDSVVTMDSQSSGRFDNSYYRELIARRGLFTSDQELYTNSESQQTVEDFANNQAAFYAAFTSAMRNLGRIGVKTGNQGDIRRECNVFNNP